MSTRLVAENAGVRIAYEVVGSGPPLVLAHGLGYARWGWEPVVPAFAEEFTVLTFDNRGIGGSDVPEGPYSAAAMAGDLVAVLDAAGVGRAHLVGTSLGGMVAQEVAIRWPERVDRLVLACTTPGGGTAYPLPDRTLKLIAEAPALAPEVALRRFVENAVAESTVRDRPDVVERIYEKRLQFPPDPSGWQAQAVAGTTHDAFSRLQEIEAPTLILHGTEDGVVDPRNAQILEREVPDARVVLFPGTGHLFFWEEPERFVEVVREFLLEAA